MAIYNNEKLVIDSINTERGIQLIINWLRQNGKDDINVSRRPDCTLIQSVAYSSSDDVNYTTTSYKWTNIVEISSDQVIVSPTYKWKRRKSLENWAIGYSKNWRDDTIGDMLSSSNRESLDIGIGNLKPYNHKSQGEYMSESDRLRRMISEKPIYTQGENLTDGLCEFIMSIPSLIRDEKINTILKDAK